jgi:hypothetical protein
VQLKHLLGNSTAMTVRSMMVSIQC